MTATKPSVGFAQRRMLDAQKAQKAAQKSLDKLEKNYDPENQKHVKWKEELEFRLNDEREKEEWWKNIVLEAQKDGV